MSDRAVHAPAAPDPAPLVKEHDEAQQGLHQAKVLVSVGTDTHPFDRLVDWMDEWQSNSGREHAGADVVGKVTVQYGTSRAPVAATGSPLMPHADLVAAMAAASAVVTHGGPATIRDARAVGLLPLVVPRDPDLGEHVDDHQIRFTRMLAESGDIVLCRNKAELTAALDRAIVDNSWLRLADDSRSEQTATAIARVGRILDGVILEERQRRARHARRPSSLRWRRG